MPLGCWIKEDLKDFVLDYLCAKRIKKEGIFDYRYIKQIIDDHFSGRNNNRQLIWPLVTFEFWYEKYM